VVRLPFLGSLSSVDHPSIPPSPHHTFLVIIIISMADVGSTSGKDEFHHHHDGWNDYIVLGRLYRELLDLEEWTIMGVFRKSQ